MTFPIGCCADANDGCNLMAFSQTSKISRPIQSNLEFPRKQPKTKSRKSIFQPDGLLPSKGCSQFDVVQSVVRKKQHKQKVNVYFDGVYPLSPTQDRGGAYTKQT